ncbi:MAG TPA: di-heme oxidoredictase family protein [Candidatus Binatia bacterium]
MRAGAPGAGGPLAGLTDAESAYFTASTETFNEVEDAAEGLGPRMNLDSCAGCHAYPAVGGSSPLVNPQAAMVTANDKMPSFISAHGPVREVRFVRNPDGTPDGGVHDLFTITGREGADGCTMAQPDFETQVANHNVIFRIPTPVFGAGLIEQIPDTAIIANGAANSGRKVQLGIKGRANFHLPGSTISGTTNNNGNDGTVARFGWKAQNKSLLLFAGEAYNVEMGVSNELFQSERDETAACQFRATPNDFSHLDAAETFDAFSDTEKFALFMRFAAAPVPSAGTPDTSASIARGKTTFNNVGCALCHTPSFTTGNTAVAALRNQPVNLYSDLLVHDMGPGLADGVSQGQAGPRDFRSAPLWGLGQRLYFLHDGRTADLAQAIQAHQSGSVRTGNASEANGVITLYNFLPESQKQDLLNFLRSL